MKKFAVLAVGLLGGISSWCFAASGVEGRVDIDAGSLNFRIRPEMTAPVAVRLPKGTVVRVTKEQGNWAEVSAPAEMGLYAAEINIIDGRVCRDTNLRLSADIKSPVAGTLKRGETVTVIGESKYGWLKVVPPERIRVYAVKFYLSYDESALAAAAEKPEAAAPAVDKQVEKPVVKPVVKPVEKPVAKPAEKVEKKAETPAPVKTAAVKETKPAVKPAAVAPAAAKKVETKTDEVKKQVKQPVKPQVKPAAKEEKKEVKKTFAVVPVQQQQPFSYTGEICGSTRDALLAVGIAGNDNGKNITLGGTITKFQASTYMATDWYLTKQDGALDSFIIPAGGQLNFNAFEGRKVKVNGKSFNVPNWKHSIIVVNEIIED